MSCIMIVVVKYVGKEGFSFHHLKIAILVSVMLIKDDFGVLNSFIPAFFSATLQTIHILIEDVSSEQVSEEVESHEHEEHEEQ